MDLVTLGASLNGAKKQTEDYVASHFKGGANIEIVDNPDGTQTIHASGEVSSTDTVAREAIVEHIQDDDNPHKVTKSQVGLGNVDNTADIDKPISAATQTALNAKANTADVYTKTEVDALIDDIDVPTALADLTDDSTHRLVTDTEKAKINGLANIKTIGVGLNLDNATGELTATGGGTGGTTNYNDLSNKPQINSVTLSGNKSSADLGLADASDIPTALSDLTDDAIHRTVTDTEKAAWNNKSDFSGDYDDLTNKPTIPKNLAELSEDSTHRVVTDSEKSAWNAKADISDITVKGIKKNNDALTPDSSGIVNITVPTTASDVNALSDSTLYGASLSLEINSTTYVVTATLKDQNGDTLGTAQTIDLPLESVVVSGSYDSTTKKVILTLQSGSTVEFSVADLVSGLQSEITSANKLDADLIDDSTSINKFVTSAEKTAWNNKSDFSGNYNDLSNKPTIPSALTDLTDDSTHRLVTDTEKTAWNAKSDFSGSYKDLTDKPTIPSSAADINALPASTLYAGASTAGGAATSANKINTDAGSATQPVYFDNGVPVATTYSLAKSVPADAIFTDTTYESKVAAIGGTDVSLCTTGEKYIWNNKQSALDSTQLSAVNSGIDSTKVAQIATNASDISSLTTAVSAKIGATDYATQTTGGTVKVWTTTESGETTLHIATE